MPVRHHDHTKRLGTHLPAPALTECNEESLITSQALCGWCFLAAIRRSVSIIRSRQTCDVGNILTQRLLAVQMKTRQRLVGVVLRRELVRSRLEMIVIFL